tara:strand:- start:1078 stop:1194 length:117 start_codon:yes stop_codon:yes gene_type:complete
MAEEKKKSSPPYGLIAFIAIALLFLGGGYYALFGFKKP